MKIGIQYMIVGLLFFIAANTGKGEIGSAIFGGLWCGLLLCIRL